MTETQSLPPDADGIRTGTHTVPGFSRTTVQPVRLPPGVSIEAAYAALAALNAEATADFSPAQVASRIGWMPSPDGERPADFLKDFAATWTLRAAIQYGEHCDSLHRHKVEYVSGYTYRGAIIQTEAEAALAEHYGADAEHVEALRQQAKTARDGLRLWYELNNAAQPTAPVQKQEEPEPFDFGDAPTHPTEPVRHTTRYGMNPQTMNYLAALNHGGRVSEGDLLQVCRNSSLLIQGYGKQYAGRGIFYRVQLREEIEDAITRGLEFIQNGNGTLLPERPPRHRPYIMTCPTCLFQCAGVKSLCMYMGMNHGGGSCPACGLTLEVRCYNDAGELNTTGETLRAFRSGEAPGTLRPPSGRVMSWGGLE